MPFIDAPDGTRIFHQDLGSGRPVVLIHGWPLNADMWEYQVGALLEAGHRVVAYDRRGFGRSDKPAGGYDYDTLAGDLDALIRALDLRDAALVGFSMGGGEVARFLSRHNAKGRATRAVLMSAVTPMLGEAPDHPDGVPQETFDQMVEGLRQDRPKFLADFGKTFFGAGLLNFTVSQEIMGWAQSLALQASPIATIACARAFSRTDFRADCAAIGVPTLVMHGTSDATVPIDTTGRKSAATIPGATLIEYPSAPHAVFFTDKDAVNADLVAFLAR